MTQNGRQVLWIVDNPGNSGKSYFANYLNILYNYLLLDGTMKVRDVALFCNKKVNGIAIDVPRASIGDFNYDCVEAFKNGYISTGKYSGRTTRFHPVPVVVFSNDHPDYRKLSRDRWNILTVGEGALQNPSRAPIINPEMEYPFVPPIEPPSLSEEFNLREFVCEYMPEYRVPDPQPPQAPQPPQPQPPQAPQPPQPPQAQPPQPQQPPAPQPQPQQPHAPQPQQPQAPQPPKPQSPRTRLSPPPRQPDPPMPAQRYHYSQVPGPSVRSPVGHNDPGKYLHLCCGI